MMSKGVRKKAGCSMIEIDGVVHEFLAGEDFHPNLISGVATLAVVAGTSV